MANFVQVPPDAGGKEIEANTPNVDNHGNQLYRQVITPGSATGTVTQAYTASGEALVVVDNFPAIQDVAIVSGSVVVPNPLGVSGNINVLNTVAISGSVSLLSGAVTVPNPLGVSGTINVGNFPSTQNVQVVNVTAVSGTITANQGTSPWVTSVNNFPSVVNPIGVTGTVSINQPVNVNVLNTVTVSGSVSLVGGSTTVPNPLGVSGTVSIGNFPNPQNVIVLNTVAVSGNLNSTVNIPNPLGVSGSISVLNTISGNINLTELAGIALGQPSIYGISPGNVKVPGVNAYVTNTVPVSGALSVTFPSNQNVSVINTAAVSGTVTVDQGTSNNDASDGWTVAIVDNQGNGPVEVMELGDNSYALASGIVDTNGFQIDSTLDGIGLGAARGLNVHITNTTLDNIPVEISGEVAVTNNGDSGTQVWNNATPINSLAYNDVVGDPIRWANFSVTIADLNVGSITGGAATIEASNDTVNWFPLTGEIIAGVGVGTESTSLVPFTSGINITIGLNLTGFTNFRVRLSSLVLGSGSIEVIVSVQTFGQVPIISSVGTIGQTVPVNGTYVSFNNGLNSSGSLVGVSSNHPLPVSVINTAAVSGTVSVNNFPSSINVQNPLGVSGTVTVLQGGGSPWSINETQLAGVPLGIPSTYGIAPGGAVVQGVNAFVSNTVSVSGTINVANFPPTQNVQVINTTGVSGSISVLNTISGNINLTEISGVPVVMTSTPIVSGQFIPVITPSSATVNVPSVLSVSGTSGLLWAANSNRKEIIIVNTGTSTVYLGLGYGPSTTVYHIPLPGCTSSNNGTGGIWISDLYVGAIYAISASGIGTVVVTELT